MLQYIFNLCSCKLFGNYSIAKRKDIYNISSCYIAFSIVSRIFPPLNKEISALVLSSKMSLIKLPKLVSFVLTFSYEPSRVFVVTPITLSNIFSCCSFISSTFYLQRSQAYTLMLLLFQLI